MKNKKFRNLIIHTGRVNWRLTNSLLSELFGIRSLQIVFIDYRNWGYVNNVYPVMEGFRDDINV